MDRWFQPKEAHSALRRPFSSFFKLPFDLLMFVVSFLGLSTAGDHVSGFAAHSILEYKRAFCDINVLFYLIERFSNEHFDNIRHALINRHNIQSVFMMGLLSENWKKLFVGTPAKVTFQGGMFTSIGRWLRGELIAIKDVDVFFPDDLDVAGNFPALFAPVIAKAIRDASPMYLEGLDNVVDNNIYVDIFKVYDKYGTCTKKCRITFKRQELVVGYVSIDLTQYGINTPVPLFTYRTAQLDTHLVPAVAIPYPEFDALLEHLSLNCNMCDSVAYRDFQKALETMEATLAWSYGQIADKLDIRSIADLVRMRIPVQLQHATNSGFEVKPETRNFLETLHSLAVGSTFIIKFEALERRWLARRRGLEFVLNAEMNKLFGAKQTIMNLLPKRPFQPIVTNAQLCTERYSAQLMREVVFTLRRTAPTHRLFHAIYGAEYRYQENRWNEKFVMHRLNQKYRHFACYSCRKLVRLEGVCWMRDVPSKAESCQCEAPKHCVASACPAPMAMYDILPLHIPLYLQVNPLRREPPSP